MVHDTYKHLRVLSTLADSGDLEAMSAYIYQLGEDAHKTYGGQVLPGYPAIDAVLRRKIYEAELQGISVSHDINLFPGLAIEPVDICVVLGNALDNAIEACAHIETERRIDIRMSFIKNKLAIVIANTSRPVEIIPVTPVHLEKDIHKRELRVAAYCRVSTDSEEQLNSYKSQIEYYTTIISENPAGNWLASSLTRGCPVPPPKSGNSSTAWYRNADGARSTWS